MVYLREALFFLVAIIIQTTLVELIKIKDIKPDIVLLLLIFYGIKKPQYHSTILGFLSGIFQDIIGGGFLGLFALTKTVSGFFITIFRRIGKFKEIHSYILVLVATCLLHDILFYFIYTFNSHLSFSGMLLRYAIPKTIYTSGIGGIILISKMR